MPLLLRILFPSPISSATAASVPTASAASTDSEPKTYEEIVIYEERHNVASRMLLQQEAQGVGEGGEGMRLVKWA